MRYALAATLLALVACSLTSASDKNQDDIKKLTGMWELESLEANGEKADVSQASQEPAEFVGDKVLINGEEAFSIKLDAATDPKIIDFTRLQGDDKGQVLEGIYKLDGDTLTVCAWSGEGTRSRPTEFATKPGSNIVLAVLKRK